MIQYSAIRPKLYVETTVISYLVARPSNDASLAYRQQITRQLWEYANAYEFVVSDIVISEILKGDAVAAQRRFDAVANLTILDLSPDVDKLNPSCYPQILSIVTRFFGHFLHPVGVECL